MEVVVVAVTIDLVANHRLRQVLEVEVERGVDAVALAVAGADVELLFEHLQDVIDEVRRLQRIARVERLQLLVLRRQRLRGRDHLLRHHGVQHVELPNLRLSGVDQRAVLRRRLRQSGQHRCLPERQVVRGGVVEGSRRRLDAVALAAVVDRIQIHLQNLVFRITAVEVDGERRLADLALDGRRRIRPDKDLLDQLLADGAAALGDVVVRVVGDGGSGDPTEIDAVVLVEGLILDRDRRLADVGRHRFQRDHNPMVAVIADVVDQRAMPVEDQHVLFEAAGGEAVDRGQAADRLGGDGRNRHQWEREDQQRAEDHDAANSRTALALAEQPKPPVEDVAGASPARHQTSGSELKRGLPDITKDDSANVGKCVEVEIRAEYV